MTAADELVETVRRGDFRLEITESGEIESSGNTEVRCEVKSNNTAGTAILRLVPEGTQVKPGDFLVELDSSALDKDRIQQQIVVNTSEAVLTEARSAYETAVLAKQEYMDGTFKQEKEVIESEIFVAEENLRRAAGVPALQPAADGEGLHHANCSSRPIDSPSTRRRRNSKPPAPSSTCSSGSPGPRCSNSSKAISSRIVPNGKRKRAATSSRSAS